MNLGSHLTELRKKHEILAQKVEQEQRSPGSSDLQIAELKRQKLNLKDEITRISHEV